MPGEENREGGRREGDHWSVLPDDQYKIPMPSSSRKKIKILDAVVAETDS